MGGTAPNTGQTGREGTGESGLDPRNVAGYSRFVSLAKKLLPVVALLLIALIGAWPYMQAKDDSFRIGFSALQDREGEEPSMLNPRYLGTDDNRQPFSVTADLAKNLLQGGAVVELEMPKADVTLDDGTWLVLTAETGRFDKQGKALELAGSVNLFHDSGYEFRTSQAFVDLAAGVARGDVPVEGQGPFGQLKAEGFRLLDKGKTIVFTGKSKVIIHPGAGGQMP